MSLDWVFTLNNMLNFCSMCSKKCMPKILYTSTLWTDYHHRTDALFPAVAASHLFHQCNNVVRDKALTPRFFDAR